MLSSRVLSGVRSVRAVVHRRNLGVAAPAMAKATDPIQQLFLDKIREYKQKSGSDGKLVEPTPDIQKEMTSEMEKLERQYGGGTGVDMTKFPTFKFEEPKLDPIDLPKA